MPSLSTPILITTQYETANRHTYRQGLRSASRPGAPALTSTAAPFRPAKSTPTLSPRARRPSLTARYTPFRLKASRTYSRIGNYYSNTLPTGGTFDKDERIIGFNITAWGKNFTVGTYNPESTSDQEL